MAEPGEKVFIINYQLINTAERFGLKFENQSINIEELQNYDRIEYKKSDNPIDGDAVLEIGVNTSTGIVDSLDYVNKTDAVSLTPSEIKGIGVANSLGTVASGIKSLQESYDEGDSIPKATVAATAKVGFEYLAGAAVVPVLVATGINPLLGLAVLGVYGITAGLAGDGIKDITGGYYDLIEDVFKNPPPLSPGRNPFPPIDDMQNYYDKLRKSGEIQKDPVAVDLDWDGVESVSREDGVYFDLNNDGVKEKTGWVASDDGLLVMDRNDNGEIDNGGELFGDQTRFNDGTIAESGFEALSELDSNGNGKINKNLYPQITQITLIFIMFQSGCLHISKA